MEKQKRPNFVIIGILTVVTIFLWIGFNVYRTFTVTPSIKVPDEILKPIMPTLDSETLSKIDQRVFFEEGEIRQILISTPATTPTPTPTPTEVETEEIATESASPATEAAELQ